MASEVQLRNQIVHLALAYHRAHELWAASEDESVAQSVALHDCMQAADETLRRAAAQLERLLPKAVPARRSDRVGG